MAYCIIRADKLTSFGNIGGSAQHNFRERVTHNADPERTPSNITSGAQSSKEVIAGVKARLETVPKVRKNAVLAIEYMIGASPEWFKEQTESDREAYFDAAEKWLKARHGAENVISFTRQYDETSPHVCAYVVPLDPKGKLNCSYYLDGRIKLSEMQTEFADKVGKQFNLERGIEGSKAKHQTVKQYYAKIQSADSNPEIDRAKALQYDIEKAKNALRDAKLSELRASAALAREIPLQAVLERLGCTPDPKDKNNWRTPAGRVTIDGAKFYAHDQAKGGGGAIDLVMLLEQIHDFKTAVKWLADEIGIKETVADHLFKFKAQVEALSSLPKPPFVPPPPASDKWPVVRHYLINKRKLNKELVDFLHENGKIYADQHSNAVFNLYKNKGVELRGTLENSGFKGVRGAKSTFVMSGMPDVEQVAFVESAIDAISLKNLGFEGRVLSFAGNSKHKQIEIAEKYHERGWTVFAAFDNDPAGDAMSAVLPDYCRRIKPDLKDWNDDLRAAIHAQELEARQDRYDPQ